MIISIEERIKKLLDDRFANTTYYYISVSMNPKNKDILIVVDNETPLSIKEYTDIHKYLRKNIGDEFLEYNVEVSSPGLSEAIFDNRQYRNKKGRFLDIITKTDEVFFGKVLAVDEGQIELEIIDRKKLERKPLKLVGNGSLKIQFSNIKIAKEVITF